MNFYLQTESEPAKPVEKSARPVMDVLLLDRNVAEAADLRAKLADSRYAAFSVTSTAAVADALQLLEMKRFDVVLADADTPANRGLATFAELHSISPNTRMLAVSSV
jgi:response regulator RpfG family c-di-GMP phosphodiesterase